MKIFANCFAFTVLSLPSLFCHAQIDDKKVLLAQCEQALIDYAAKQDAMKRYIAIAQGEQQGLDQGGGRNELVLMNFDYTYCLDRRKTTPEDVERVEKDKHLWVSDDVTSHDIRQLLKSDGHYWISRGSGRFFDVTTMPEKERDAKKQIFMPIWDPFAAPIMSYCEIDTHIPSYRKAIQVLFKRELFDGSVDKSGNLVGSWYCGTANDHDGYFQISFDPEIDYLPVDFKLRLLKIGTSKIEMKNLIGCTKLYQHNTTKWMKHASGKLLPAEVQCVSPFWNQMNGWKLNIQWWLDNEVPDAVFTFDDIKMSSIGESVIDKLVHERQQHLSIKAAAAR